MSPLQPYKHETFLARLFRRSGNSWRTLSQISKGSGILLVTVRLYAQNEADNLERGSFGQIRYKPEILNERLPEPVVKPKAETRLPDPRPKPKPIEPSQVFLKPASKPAPDPNFYPRSQRIKDLKALRATCAKVRYSGYEVYLKYMDERLERFAKGEL